MCNFYYFIKKEKKMKCVDQFCWMIEAVIYPINVYEYMVGTTKFYEAACGKENKNQTLFSLSREQFLELEKLVQKQRKAKLIDWLFEGQTVRKPFAWETR